MSERKCVNCRHRTLDSLRRSRCEIDGHYIGYLECFDGWCRHWAKDKFMYGESENGKQTHIGSSEAR